MLDLSLFFSVTASVIFIFLIIGLIVSAILLKKAKNSKEESNIMVYFSGFFMMITIFIALFIFVKKP